MSMIQTLEELSLELNKNSGVMFLGHIPVELYRSHKAMSQSELKLIADKSPAHYQHQRRYPRPETDPMKLGTAAHTAILEPLLYEERYVCGPKVDKRTKDGKLAWKDAYASAKDIGKELLPPDIYYPPLEMRDAIRSNRRISELLENGVAERSCFGHLYGLPGKALLDFYRPGTHEIIDLKSTRTANAHFFEKDIRKYRYHWQACWYSDLVKEITGDAPRFKILAVESIPPYGARVFEIKFDLMAIARKEIMEAVDSIRRCLDTGVWPGYPEGTYEVKAHKWEWESYKKAIHEANAKS